jgi:hypothetical protein
LQDSIKQIYDNPDLVDKIDACKDNIIFIAIKSFVVEFKSSLAVTKEFASLLCKWASALLVCCVEIRPQTSKPSG